MISFATITIYLLLVIIFSIIILVAILLVQKHRNDNPYYDCNSNKDCLLGYVCISEPINSQGICRGISGTLCSSNSQCQPGLQCTVTTGGTGVCTNKPPLLPVPPMSNTQALTMTVTQNTETAIRLPDKPSITVKELQPQQEHASVQLSAVKRPILTSMLQATSTTDNEMNSDGQVTDGPFDIRSQCSSSRSHGSTSSQYRGSVSTPCEEHNGVYYCRGGYKEPDNVNRTNTLAKPNQVTELGDEISATEHSTVIDVCSYSSATVYLLANGSIICENENGRWRAVNNVKLQRIVSYNGYIYGVSETRSLYKLSSDKFTKGEWSWTIVDWAPYNIMHVCTTLDSKALWIQAREIDEDSIRGTLHAATGVTFHDSTNIKRIYGRDVEHYLDINVNNQVATLYPGAINYNNVYDAALSYYNEVVSISPSERHLYKAITMVDWKPYYIRK